MNFIHTNYSLSSDRAPPITITIQVELAERCDSVDDSLEGAGFTNRYAFATGMWKPLLANSVHQLGAAVGFTTSPIKMLQILSGGSLSAVTGWCR